MRWIMDIFVSIKMRRSGALEKTQIYLCLGSNLGHRKRNLRKARKRIGKRVGKITRRSGLYESVPWGYSSENLFMNCCLAVETDLEPLRVMDALLSVEHSLGRSDHGEGYADRLIDIDLLLYGDLVMDHHRLKLPHPRMGDRKFVLMPLAEIAPDVVHPLEKITIREMLERCRDQTLCSTRSSQNR